MSRYGEKICGDRAGGNLLACREDDTDPSTPIRMPVNENLRDRILRQLEVLSDERGYQVLDYVDFLADRYAEKPGGVPNPFVRFTDAVEDRLRAGKVSASAIAETVSLMNRAANAFNAARSRRRGPAANEFVNAATPPRAPGAAGATPREAPSRRRPRATLKPGSGEEKL